MSKASWKEEHEKEMKNYDKSILSHSDDPDPMSEYESNIMHHSDDPDPMSDYEGMKHFQE